MLQLSASMWRVVHRVTCSTHGHLEFLSCFSSLEINRQELQWSWGHCRALNPVRPWSLTSTLMVWGMKGGRCKASLSCYTVVLPALYFVLGYWQVNGDGLCGGALAVSDKIRFGNKVDSQCRVGGRKSDWCLWLALNSIYKLRTLKGSKTKASALASTQQSAQQKQALCPGEEICWQWCCRSGEPSRETPELAVQRQPHCFSTQSLLHMYFIGFLCKKDDLEGGEGWVWAPSCLCCDFQQRRWRTSSWAESMYAFGRETRSSSAPFQHEQSTEVTISSWSPINGVYSCVSEIQRHLFKRYSAIQRDEYHPEVAKWQIASGLQNLVGHEHFCRNP